MSATKDINWSSFDIIVQSEVQSDWRLGGFEHIDERKDKDG